MDVKLKREEKAKVVNEKVLADIMQRILKSESPVDRVKEHFWTIGLDNGNRILYVELISLGTTTKTLADPVQVFRVGVLKNAVKMVLCHNHPSGQMMPSRSDNDLTDRMIQSGILLGIDVVDHLIISPKAFYSYAVTGLLNDLKQSRLFVPNYKVKEEFLKEIGKELVERTKKNHAKHTALLMKIKGYSTEQIMEITGLSKYVIVRIKID